MSPATVRSWQPASEAKRHVAIDALRGLALFGVLLVNLEVDFRISLFQHITTIHTDPGWWNHVTDLLVLAELWITPARAATVATPFPAAGRMAFTNYLSQSVILGFLFYGYGLAEWLWRSLTYGRRQPMRFSPLRLAAGLALCSAAFSQGLPPDVLLLSRVKRHTQAQLQHLPDISCLETVQREHKPANSKSTGIDTVRLEVLTSGSREFFASPGDRRFSERPPISYAGSGVLGDGVFGLYLKTVLLNSNVSTAYKGEEEVAGRRLARWDYRLPLMWSGQTIQLPEGSGSVGLHGSFWADPETNDVVRLELIGEDFPVSLPLAEAVWSINYAPLAVGDGLVALLPQSGEFRMARFTGETNRNQIEFTHCRTFAVQSALRFDSADSVETPRFGVASLDETLRSLPRGLHVAVTLRTRITADTAVGAMIDGVVAANVPAKGPVVIAAGSPVRGHIRRLEHYTDPFPYYVVALEFTEVELQGIRHRFYADLLSIGSAPGVETTLPIAMRTEEVSLGSQGRVTRKTAESLTVSGLPGVATFFFKGAKLDLLTGFRTDWQTRTLAP